MENLTLIVIKLTREERLAQKTKWQNDNKERCKSIRKVWMEKNKEKIKQQAYTWRKNNPDRLKERRPHWHRKALYGISEEQFNNKLQKQNGKCAICLNQPKKNEKQLCVDHCHVTGKFRGLLCQSCNRAIGLMGENQENLNRAIVYLSVCMADERERDFYRD